MIAIRVLIGPLLLVAACNAGAAADDSSPDARALLRKHGIGTSADRLVEFLASHCPTAGQHKAISIHVEGLGHEDYQTRKASAAALKRYGPLAAPALQEAFRSTDVEIALKARRLWREIESIQNSTTQYDLVTSAIRLLAEGEHPAAVPVLIRLIDQVDSRPLNDLATTVIWRSATANHGDLLKEALNSSSQRSRTMAIPALEIALGEASVEQLQPFLNSPQPRLRLAATRALIDRLPAESFAVLVDLLEEDNRGIGLQAAWLLNEAVPPEQEIDDHLKAYEAQVARWKLLTESFDADQIELPLGARRLALKFYPLAFVEEFADNAALIQRTYGYFSYSSTIPAKASVEGGRLRLDGNHPEADQRMVIPAKAVFGSEAFPARFRVTSRMTGDPGGEGGWHMGLSIGKLKFLFHPGHSGGGFRVEDVTSHKYHVFNQNMGFTPTPGVMLTMTVTVSPGTGLEGNQFDVEIVNEKTKQVYRHKYECGPDISGRLNAVGLERSGRTGGAALFERLAIDLGVETNDEALPFDF